jgi:hypothetical protein
MLLRQRTSWIDEANNLISIADVLGSQGVYVPDNVRQGGTKKVHCPFGFYHSDNGLSKAMRVYGASNTAYCFSCSKSYSPVTLAAAAWDCSLNAAALRLLEDIGYKRKTVAERWAEATAEKTSEIDILELAEALKIYCAGISPDWEMLQLQDDVAALLNRCLSLVKAVKTDEQADKWLIVCKQAMASKLKEMS